MRRTGHTRQAKPAWLVVVGIALSLGFAAMFAFTMWSARNRDRLEAIRAADNVISAINSEIQRNLELYDLSLQAVVEGLALPNLSSLTPELRNLLLFDRAATAKGMGSILVLDRNGRVTIDSRSTVSPSRTNYAQTDFFKVAASLRSTNPYLSRPWRDGDGEWLISISRRVDDANGHFSRLVVGTLKLSYFRDLFTRLNLGARDALTLVREDGSVVVRIPGGEQFTGRNLSSYSIFQHIQSRPRGQFDSVAELDGVERTYVYQRIGDWPLTATYAISAHSMFANWRRQTWVTGALAGLLIAANLALVAFLVIALSAKRKAEARLTELASTDPLTGLYNRREFDNKFNVEWSKACVAETPLSLLVADADHFKLLNDAYGHMEGDRALERIGHLLRETTASNNGICARYGGEEFVVLLPGFNLHSSQDFAECLRQAVAQAVGTEAARGLHLPTLSIGVCSVVPNETMRTSDLFEAADAALYLAKSQGRNRVGASQMARQSAA